MKKNGVLHEGIKVILFALAAIIINSASYLNCGTYSVMSEENNVSMIAYSELNEYKLRLKENIILLKEEREDKEAYLAELDKRFAELESQYKELLEQKKRISDELAAVSAGKN